MSVSVTMPQLGESVTEGTVTRWLKKEGEHVTADEPLLEVSTDKVDTEIPAPASGILRGIVVDEDETVLVHGDFAQDAGGGGRDLGVHLVRRDLKQRLVSRHAVAFLFQPARDGALGDALTELRHGYGDRHSRDS